MAVFFFGPPTNGEAQFFFDFWTFFFGDVIFFSIFFNMGKQKSEGSSLRNEPVLKTGLNFFT